MTGERFCYPQREGAPRNEDGESLKTIRILGDLVRIPSFVDGEHNEAQLAEHIRKIFLNSGRYQVNTQVVEGNRVNLIVHDGTPPKVVLFGHMDTVLPKLETDSPFDPRIVDGKLYGLGATDMKAGLAVMIAAALENRRPGLALVFTSDEEYDFKGAIKLAEEVELHPKIIINLEPTNGEILTGCRGITEFSAEVHGKSAHASRKALGINAIEKAVELSHSLQANLTGLDLDSVNNSLNLAYLHGGVLQEKNPDGSNKISGLGMVVPNFAEVNFEIRIANPLVTKDMVTAAINDIAKRLEIEVDNLNFKFILGSMSTPRSHLESFEQSVAACGLPIVYADINKSGFYEVQLIKEKWGCDVVAFGPGPREVCHSANEYVEVESVSRSQAVVNHFLRKTL
jgi:acetylornithine deacetylase/succinyl-diaminopimelate desuccinylase-like protein